MRSGRFRGVSYDRTRDKWCAWIRHTFLGRFATEEEAARAYDRAALALWGDEAATNLEVP